MARRLWIAVERHIVSRDIIGHASEVLGRTRAHVLGHMVAMWGEVAEDAKEGRVLDVRPATIEHWAQWDGEPGAFAAFIMEHCLTDGVISGWDEMQGRFEREKRADAERKAAVRKSPPDVRQKSAGRPRKSTVTIQDNTIQDSTTTSQPAVAADGLKEWLTPIAQAWETVNGAGSFPWSRGTKALKILFGKVESATLAERLGRYLQADGKFASPERFVITHGQHAEAPADKHAAAVKAKRDRMFQEQGANLPNGDMTEIMDLVTNPNRVAEARRLGVIL